MIGRTIGSYEIRSALGAGGMGEVYRARDSKLGRDVALKVLPQTFAADPDRVARFRREAQVLASLNHTNIAAIHGLEEADGVPVLVLELVEGPTLADRIVQERLTIDEAVAIAQQVAAALEAAHEHGVIHRDLKPANIKLRPDGAVKVLDFGLAKALDGPAHAGPAEAGHYARPAEAGHYARPAEAGHDARDGRIADDRSVRLQPDLTASPTITSPAMSRLGVILGTASYMSPEQARGLVVDRGADIWAWGCVLFEMLAGRRAFDGADTTDVIAAVVRGEPDWSRLPSETPAAVRRLLRRCFEKDPKRRLADIRDARFTLEDLEKDPAPAARATTSGRERLAWIAALIVCIAGGAALVLRPEAPAPAAREMRVEITTPPTTDPVSIALSPDGERIAFVAAAEGRPMLWARSLATGEAAPLPNTDGASLPFWAPDSRSIGFFANDRLYRIGVDGGSLKELSVAPVGAGGTWSREGVILFTLTPDGPISRIPDIGGAPVPVPGSIEGQGGNRFPQFLPDGRHYLYFVAEAAVRGLYVGTLDGPERRHLLDADAAGVVVPPGDILFVRAGRLFMQRFDPTALALGGEPRMMASSIVVDSNGAVAASASSQGSIVYRTGSANRQRQLAWVDRDGMPIGEAFPPDSGNPLNPALSPNGRYAAMTRTAGGITNIWLQDLTRQGALTKLTSSRTPDISPVWSHDGQHVAYGRIAQGFGIGLSAMSGAAPSFLFDSPQQEIPVDWSRDGQFILYRSQAMTASIDLFALSIKDPQKPLPVIQTPADERTGRISPDSKWVAFESNESGQYQVYVQAFPTPGNKTIVSTAGGRQARWGADSNELFYVAPDARVMSVALKPRPDGRAIDALPPVPRFAAKILGVPTGGSTIEYDVSRDGKRFLLNTLVEHADTPITLILNASAASR